MRNLRRRGVSPGHHRVGCRVGCRVGRRTPYPLPRRQPSRQGHGRPGHNMTVRGESRSVNAPPKSNTSPRGNRPRPAAPMSALPALPPSRSRAAQRGKRHAEGAVAKHRQTLARQDHGERTDAQRRPHSFEHVGVSHSPTRRRRGTGAWTGPRGAWDERGMTACGPASSIPSRRCGWSPTRIGREGRLSERLSLSAGALPPAPSVTSPTGVKPFR